MNRFVIVAASAALAVQLASPAGAQFVAGTGQVTGSIIGFGTNVGTGNALNVFLSPNNATWSANESSGSGTTSGGLCDGNDDGDCADQGESVVATIDATFTATATGLRTGQTVYRVRGNGVTTFDGSGRYTGQISFALTLRQLVITIPGPDPMPVTMTSGAISSTADGTQYSGGLVPPGTYELPNFALGGSASAQAGGETRTFDWELRVGPAKPCCQPWDNGPFDRTAAQLSQISNSQTDWKLVRQYAADDFYLCEGQVHRIDRISGTLNTNSLLPKALVIVYSDCDGLPDRIVAVAGLSGTRFESPSDENLITGTIAIEDTGEVFEGTRVLRVTAEFDKLWLRGGTHWVSIVGFSAALDPRDEFFWGHSGNGAVKGRPGVFAGETDGQWIDSSELCCGCTDYNFCVVGESCKILLDNGGPLIGGVAPVPGSPSLQNGSNTQTRSRAADQVVVPPCTRLRPCYVEAWLWTNCDRAGLEFLRGGCKCPPNAPISTGYLESDCVMETGLTLPDGSTVVELKKFQWFFDDLPALEAMIGPRGAGGFNLFLSVFGLGDNRQNARAYWAFNERCDRACDFSFGPGCIRSAPADQNPWRSNQTIPTATILGHDYAFLIAVHDLDPRQTPVVTEACRADTDRNGQLTVQDLFDFLAAWFAGCP